MHSGDFHQRIKSFHDRYGPKVRIGPNQISYIESQAWKDIYAPSNQLNALGEPQGLIERNPAFFTKVNRTDPHSIMGNNEAAHARYRRAFMGAFSDKALRDYSHVLEDNVGLFINKLSILASRSESLDLTSWFNFLTFDISGTLSFGESFGSTEAGRAHPWVDISCGFGKGFVMMASLNYLGLTKGPLGKLIRLALPKAAREKFIYHKQLTQEKVGSYLETSDSKHNAPFIDSAVTFNDTTKHQSSIVTQSELALNMSIFIFAGSETTSTALTAIVTHLLQNRTHLANVTNELRSTFSTSSAITVSSTHNLPYMTAVIQESMRLTPSVVVGVPRVVPNGGALICNDMLPEGTYVVVNQYAAFRSASNFTDPETFNPDRFLHGDTSSYNQNIEIKPSSTSKSTTSPLQPQPQSQPQKDTLEAFHPFSLGRHQCLGMRLAWAMTRLTLARLLYTFDIEFADANDARNTRDFGEQKTFMFWEKESLGVRLTLRDI